MNKLRITKKIIAVILVVSMLTALTACGRDRDEAAKALAVYDSYTLNIWYNNDTYTSYLNTVSEEFNHTNMMITLNPILVSGENYLRKIYEGSVSGDTEVDLYIISTDMLEQAYLMGIMDRIDSERIPDAVNAYGNTAVEASSYNNSMYGYPLTFNTSYMIYNKDIATDIKSFSELSDFITSYRDGNSKLKSIFECDPYNSIINYPYVANYIKYNNNFNTAEVSLELNETKIKRALSELNELNQQLGVSGKYDMDQCIDMFNKGELAYTFIDANHFSKIYGSGINFGVSSLPSISNTLDVKGFSNTTMIVVNPYSVNLEAAHAMAKALSYDYSDEFFDNTGRLPACRAAQDSLVKEDEVNKVYDIYGNSISKSRFIGADTGYSAFGTMLNALINGTSIDDAYKTFADTSLSSIRQIEKQN